MIDYQAGVSLKLLCTIKGSVFPKALAWSVPAAIIAGLLNYLFLLDEDSDEPSSSKWLLDVRGMHILWSSYSFVLGFLVVFRNGQAYSRFWEGAELIHQVRGEWINAMSSLIAFCNTDQAKAHDVAKFQHCAVRMMSMLHCAALQQIAEVEDHSFEILDPAGLDKERLQFLSELHPVERCQVLLQWLQRIIIDADEEKTLKVAPPILSRVYQELSRGIVNLDNVAKIKQVPFPFPYAQMIAAMMIIHWIITPILASQAISSGFWAMFMTFVTLSAFWSLFYIANEIEQPFGKDDNDLPVSEMQAEMNHSLTLLLRHEVQMAPAFEFCHDSHSKLHRSESSMTIPGTGKEQRHRFIEKAGAVEKVAKISQRDALKDAQKESIIETAQKDGEGSKSLPTPMITEGVEPPAENAAAPSLASGVSVRQDLQSPAQSRQSPSTSVAPSVQNPMPKTEVQLRDAELVDIMPRADDSALEQPNSARDPSASASSAGDSGRVPAEGKGGDRASNGPISSTATKPHGRNMAPNRDEVSPGPSEHGKI